MTVRKIKRNKTAVEELTIAEAFKEFIYEKEAKNLSQTSLKNYRNTFNIFMNFFDYDEETLLSEISQSDLYEWMGTMKVEGIKVSSVNAYLTNIKTFFRWCMDEDKGYMKPFKFPQMKGQEEPIKLFSDDDIETLLARPQNEDDFVECRTWAIVNWILATGNRGATVCEVKISDIDFKSKEIQLRHTKNKKAQIIPLSPTLESVIKKYIKEWRDKDDEWLFPTISNEQLTTAAMRKSFVRYCSDRGVAQHNIHGLRHNFAKYWVQNNGNIFALQQILGHSSLDMTRRYVKLFNEDIKTDYERYSALDTIKRTQSRIKVVSKK
ncbi:MAG: tyrosine-type recombinase/integrase [Romboutsia timonensis]